MIKTFRGKLKDDEQDRIRLSTKKGKIGYKIVHFALMGETPGSDSVEHVVKIYKIVQSTVDANVDFSDGNLLGCAYLTQSSSAGYADLNIIFEQEIFNQDIYITHEDNGPSNKPCNYYLELETISLTDNAAAVSTLRDIRLNPQVGA